MAVQITGSNLTRHFPWGYLQEKGVRLEAIYSSGTQSIRREIVAIPADAPNHAMMGMINTAKECSLEADEHLRGVIFKP